ncbi:hypothetical protein NDU88_001252 [Pleurodeles waltl]|uniref:Reverse transcriptase domain-containing protein n=1 Tax=Pleurodeles waltl TaxID=8319 RepID=A0AAV7Q343_PLEWA|nr:hypothetical protein NDU88_001252 [Pleurodeles waltl]
MAVNSLSSNPDITLKPADKGGAIVVMDTTYYQQECRRLLSDASYYRPISTDPTPRLQRKIRSMILEAETAGWITRQEAEFLDTKNPRIPYFYCLPKIHKGLPPPGRPIVSGIGSLLEPLSKFCDFFLQPIVQSTSTFLKDTKDTLVLLNDINESGTTDILICLDVEALYTNIPQEATLTSVEEILLSNTWTYNTPVSFIMQCACLALQEKFFQFEKSLFHQIQGTSMGSTFAPSLACLYMFTFEQRHILAPEQPFFSNIILWRRYIDDILVVWRGEMDRAIEFTQWVNTLDTHLRFSSTISDKEVSFLDLRITLKDGLLNSSVYHKPTDRNSLLLYNSYHPKSLRDNLPFGQFLRIRRNCSDKNDFHTQANTLCHKLRERNYPLANIRQAKKRAGNIPRDILLINNTRPPQTRLTCVTTFTPLSNRVKGIIRRFWPILNSAGATLERPLFAFKRTPNIKDLVVHTRPVAKRTPDNLGTGQWLKRIDNGAPYRHACSCAHSRTSELITRVSLYSPTISHLRVCIHRLAAHPPRPS